MRATAKYDRNSIYHSPVPTRATQRVLARPRDPPHGSVASTMAAGGRAVRAGQGEARIESLVLSDGLIFARPWRRRPAGTDARLAILRLMPSKQLREKGPLPAASTSTRRARSSRSGFPEFKALATGDIRRLPDDIVNPLGIKGLGETGSLCRLQSPMRSITTTGKRVRDLPIRLDKLQQQTGEIATLASLLRVRYGRLTVPLFSNAINNCRADHPDSNIAHGSRAGEFFNTIAPYWPLTEATRIGSGGWFASFPDLARL